MALYKYHYIELDTKRSPRISLHNIVAGETGNRIWITVTNNGETVDMSEKDNGEFIYRVCLKIDSDLGTRRQDSAQENSGITFIEAATGDHGKINILLSADSFTVGMNRCRIEIFSKRAEDNDTLIISAEFTFRAAGNPTGENAGNVYPSLIALENELNQLMDDAEEAIDDCEDATDAANTAAETLNGMLENIDDEPTQNSDHLVKSGGVYKFATDLVQDLEEDHLRPNLTPKMNGVAAIGGMTHQFAYEDHVHPSDTSKQDVLTFDNAPSASSNNPVKSGGIKTAIDTAAKKNVYLVKHDAEFTLEHSVQAQGYTDDYGDDLDTISESAVFASQIALPSGEVVTLYEYYRDDALDHYYLKSEVVGGVYVTALLNNTTSHHLSQITFELHNDEPPLMLHIDSTEEVTGGGGQTYRIVHLDSDDVALLYAQRYTREFQMHLPAWGMPEGTTLDILLRKVSVKTTGTTCVIGFSGGMAARYSDSVEEITPSGFDEWIVNVYYVDGVLHSCTASRIKKVF